MIDFLEPVNIAQLTQDEGFKDTQLGTHIAVYDHRFPDLEKADIVLVGCDSAAILKELPIGEKFPTSKWGYIIIDQCDNRFIRI
jgi:hypothetical protein